MKKSLIIVAVIVSVGMFLFLACGPQSLVPPPSWPFTKEARDNYHPFDATSRREIEYRLTGTVKPFKHD